MSLTFFIFIFIFFLNAQAALPFRVVIDPGHGGSDLGAVRDSFVESQIVLEIAQKLKTELEKRSGFEVSLTRTQDLAMTLPERVVIANNKKAHLFVSLHANTSTSSRLSGMEFYFNNPRELPPRSAAPSMQHMQNATVLAKIKQDFEQMEKTEKSLLLSKTFQRHSDLISAREENAKNIIKQATFYVIENTEMPSVLVEVGFLSNRREAKKLTDASYQNEIVQSLADAIVQYKEKSDKRSALYEN